MVLSTSPSTSCCWPCSPCRSGQQLFHPPPRSFLLVPPSLLISLALTHPSTLPPSPFHFNPSLLFSSLLHSPPPSSQIYWFSLIIKLLIKVLFLKEELSDIRDIEEEEEAGGGGGKEGGKEGGDKGKEGESTSMQNGLVSTATKKTQ